MLYSLEFFQLQVNFAKKLCELDPKNSLDHSLTRATTLAGICQLRTEPGTPNATWEEWLAEALAQPNPAQHLHRLYKNRREAITSDSREYFGCFSYNYPWQGAPTLRLHFANRLGDPEGRPLATKQLHKRKEELRNLVSHAKKSHPNIQRIRGGSWLYNLPAYRAIFPKVFLATAVSTPPKLEFMSTWGQFVDHTGNLREPQSSRFTSTIVNCRSRADCEGAFPLPRVEAECEFDRLCEELL